jgi:hypothetical protein
MERDSRHIDAPAWPWSAAGWCIAVVLVATFIARWSGAQMLAPAMVVLALATFGAMLGFVHLCDRV